MLQKHATNIHGERLDGLVLILDGSIASWAGGIRCYLRYNFSGAISGPGVLCVQHTTTQLDIGQGEYYHRHIIVGRIENICLSSKEFSNGEVFETRSS